MLTSDSSNVFLRIAENKSKQYNFDKVFHQPSTQGIRINIQNASAVILLYH